MNINKDARERARVKPRAPARSEDKFEFSIYRCRDWFAMELIDPARMTKAAKCVRRGLAEEGHGDHTGWWFEKSFITKARSNAAGMRYVKNVGLFPAGTGPPGSDDDDNPSISEDNDDVSTGQSATNLRSVAGSMAGR